MRGYFYWLGNRFAGIYSGGVTPVSISNTEVKSASGDGTTRFTLWESSTIPAFLLLFLEFDQHTGKSLQEMKENQDLFKESFSTLADRICYLIEDDYSGSHQLRLVKTHN